MKGKSNAPSPAEPVAQSEDSKHGAGPGPKEPEKPPANGGPTTTGKASFVPKTSPGKQWTPELRMQLLKELVTAVLAFFIIIYTLAIVWHTFSYVGNTAKAGDAKDLLTIMTGLAGVVVGYYFARVSADAHASQASAKADGVLSQNAHLKAKVQSISTSLNHVIDNSAQAMTGDPKAAASHITQLRSLRDELFDLTGPTVS
jgi:hypothetical protein